MEGVALVTLWCVGRQLGMCLSTLPSPACTSTRASKCQLRIVCFHLLHVCASLITWILVETMLFTGSWSLYPLEHTDDICLPALSTAADA